MCKLEKDAKILLGRITIICILSFFLAYWISLIFVKDFQKELLLHDYSIAGYLLNHTDKEIVSAFTAEKDQNDVDKGQEALKIVGYDNEDISIELLSPVWQYRNKVIGFLFAFLGGVLGTIGLVVVIYLHKHNQIIMDAENSIREFLDGNTMCRIKSEQSGELYSLFHEVNELSSILSAHAENEKNMKEFLQDIISDVSHQIKTPLSVLKMYYEIICSSENNWKAISDFSEKSIREIKRMEDVIYTLLKLARLDAGIICMEKKQENVSVIMQDILERFEVWAKREDKRIELRGNTDAVLCCDALWVSEAIGNVVKNALEHTKEGGHIKIWWKQTSLQTQIVIEDDGQGIHSEDLYNIFKRFYRSRFSQDVHGIGLGLPLAKTIVESHGGSIAVTSKINIGTVFTLTFPNLTNK